MKATKINSSLDYFTSDLQVGDLIDSYQNGLQMVTEVNYVKGGGKVVHRDLNILEKLKYKLATMFA